MFRWYIGDKSWEQSAIFIDYRLHYFWTVLYCRQLMNQTNSSADGDFYWQLVAFENPDFRLLLFNSDFTGLLSVWLDKPVTHKFCQFFAGKKGSGTYVFFKISSLPLKLVTTRGPCIARPRNTTSQVFTVLYTWMSFKCIAEAVF